MAILPKHRSWQPSSSAPPISLAWLSLALNRAPRAAGPASTGHHGHMSNADSHRSARELGRFIDRSPSPYHAVAEATELLASAGFAEHREVEDWTTRWPEGVLSSRWKPGRVGQCRPNRVAGCVSDRGRAHGQPESTDQAAARLAAAGLSQLGVEVYGGVLLNSWLDRDLGLSGRIAWPAASRLHSWFW